MKPGSQPIPISRRDACGHEFKTKFLAIDLFAGCGGLTFGLRLAGFTVAGAVEIDPVAAGTYKHNHHSTPILIKDIQIVDPVEWMNQLGIVKGELDLLAGCPPCQGFSTLRTRNGSKTNRDKRNHLIFEMLRFVVAFEPKTVMVENVPGLKDRRIYRDFVVSLRRLGYKVRSAIENVQHFGVPQRRRRLILIAGRNIPIKFATRSTEIITVRQSIAMLPRAGNSGDAMHDFSEKRKPKTLRLISKIPKDGGGRLDLPKWKQLRCHKKCDGYKDTYGRMAWDTVAPTITTGCFNPSKGRFLHPEANRCITMREAALLQSFPKSFNVPPGTSKTQTARMLGNALPPEFIRRHASEVMNSIVTSGT